MPNTLLTSEQKTKLKELIGYLHEVESSGGDVRGPLAAIKSILAPITFDTLPERAGEAYHRNVLLTEPGYEVMMATWKKNQDCLPHSHGNSTGYVMMIEGQFIETEYHWHLEKIEKTINQRLYKPDDVIAIEGHEIHAMQSLKDRGLTLHIYSPPIANMEVYDMKSETTYTVSDNCGAWIPHDENLILKKETW